MSTNKGRTFHLKSPADALWTVGDQDDTDYKDSYVIKYLWENEYLHEKVSMQVLGVVDAMFTFPETQRVLLTSEDRKIYLYSDTTKLFLVAPSLEHLCEVGMDNSHSVVYELGDAFKRWVRS